jgi:hypothetical protein
MKAIDERYIESIECRAGGIAAAHPCAASLTLGYAERQRRAAAAWERAARSAAWLLRKPRLRPDSVGRLTGLPRLPPGDATA